jgi:N-carbamoyl-L-amino-acid hydrolase
VATVGSIALHPGLVNVVAARATMTVDLRNTDEATLAGAEGRLAAFVAQVAADEGVTISSRRLARFEPVAFDPRVVDLVAEVAGASGLSVARLPSGAGHDAQMLARVCPAGMVFVPSERGISHNPAEHTAAADVEAGANVLLQVLLRLTEEGT